MPPVIRDGQNLKRMRTPDHGNRHPRMNISALRVMRAFWDVRLNNSEWLLLLAQGVLCLSIHIHGVAESSIMIPLLALMALTAFASPVSGMFFIAAAQYLPIADEAAFNPAQVGVMAWMIISLIRFHKLRFPAIRSLLWLVPWFAWSMIVTLDVSLLKPLGGPMKAVIYAIIACSLIGQSKGRYLKCMWGLSLGAIFVTIAYWAYTVGLPVTLSEWGGERAGLARLGGVRADSVMVWPPILIGMGGMVGILLATWSRHARTPLPSGPKWIAIISILVSIPPLFATMTHGAYAGLACMIIVSLCLAGHAWRCGDFGERGRKTLIGMITGFILIATVAMQFDLFGMSSRTQMLGKYYQEVSEKRGLTASRGDVWEVAIRTISKHPVFGVIASGEKEEIPLEYAATGEYLSHNVFLDVGRNAGIPGMILCMVFLLMPVYILLRNGSLIIYAPFLLSFVAVVIFWMTLSFPWYKTSWAVWMMLAVVCQNMIEARVDMPRKKRLPNSRLRETDVFQTPVNVERP